MGFVDKREKKVVTDVQKSYWTSCLSWISTGPRRWAEGTHKQTQEDARFHFSSSPNKSVTWSGLTHGSGGYSCFSWRQMFLDKVLCVYVCVWSTARTPSVIWKPNNQFSGFHITMVIQRLDTVGFCCRDQEIYSNVAMQGANDGGI